MVLLIVGIALLSIAAIFFLVYAFINFGIVWRSVIIGAITVAAIATSSFLRRKNLGATAEGVAVFGAVLLLLDAWAIRANNLFDAAAIDGWTYWGWALVSVATIFYGWSRLSQLRAPSLAAFTILAPGIALLAFGLGSELANVDRSFIALTAGSAAGIAQRVALGKDGPLNPERGIILSISSLFGLSALAISPFVWPDYEWPAFEWAPTIAAVALGVLFLVIILTLPLKERQMPGDTGLVLAPVFGPVFGGLAGVSFAAAAAASSLTMSATEVTVIAPVASAALVALLAELLWHRLKTLQAKSSTAFAAWGAVGILGIVLIWPLLRTIAPLANSIAAAFPRWQLAASDRLVDVPPESHWSEIALVAVPVLALVFWSFGRRLSGTRGIALCWTVAAIAALTAPQLEVEWMVLAAEGTLSLAAAVTLLLVSRKARGEATISPPSILNRLRPALATTAIVAAALGFAIGWASLDTWWIGAILLVAVSALIGLASRRVVSRATGFGVAAGVTILSGFPLADHLRLVSGVPLRSVPADGYLLSAIGVALILLLTGILLRIRKHLAWRVAFWVTFGLGLLVLPGAALLTTGPVSAALQLSILPIPWLGLAIAVVTLAGLGLRIATRGAERSVPEQYASAVAVAPVIYLGLRWIAMAFDQSLLGTGLILAIAGALGAAIALALSFGTAVGGPAVGSTAVGSTAVGGRGFGIPRLIPEAGVWLLILFAISQAIQNQSVGRLTLLITGIAVLLVAIDKHGLFSPQSARHHFGWLALALVVCGFWWRLSGLEVSDLKWYLIPVSALLIAISVFIARAAAKQAESSKLAAGPLIAFAGLAISLVPIGLNSTGRNQIEAIAVFCISAILLIAGSAFRNSPKWRWTADAAAAAGALGVISVLIAGWRELDRGSLELDAWAAASLLALLAAGFLQARPLPALPQQNEEPVGNGVHSIVARVFAAVGILLFAVTIQPTHLVESANLHALALIFLMCAIHLISHFVKVPPFGASISVLSIAVAIVSAIISVAIRAIDPVEIASVPIALTLAITGWDHLKQVATARSWLWIGPAVFVLLVPSLLATIHDQPLWRLVGLGVASVAIIFAGVALRLQAPFVLGTAVALIHGVATFLPQLRAVYETVPLWLWLGIGGLILVVLAARYEKRIRDLKLLGLRFMSLR